MKKIVLPFALLGLAEILIFFNDPRHFFVADSLTWIGHRYHSVGEFLAGFFHVDPASWYRPLAQRTVESLVFPLAEMNPLPYRIVGFVLFFACTIAVFILAETLTESRRIAWFSVVVFAPHLIHAFPTYDVAFTPELVFTLFYIGSAVFYIRYLRTTDRSALIASAALFVGGLLSKEAATALPPTLLAIWFFLPRRERGTDWSLFPHFVILGLYLALAVGYLHIRHVDVSHILWGNVSEVSQYKFGIGTHLLQNLDTAFSWAFGIPRGTHGQWEFAVPQMMAMLRILRALTCLGAVCVLFTARRNFLILGIAWFLTAVAPTLPLVDHFVPYYLFAPLAGFAIAMGVILDWVYAQCSRLSAPAAMTVAVLFLAAWTGIHASAANSLAPRHLLLGGAARISRATIDDIQAAYPKLPEGARLVLFNEDIPAAAGDQMGGVLLQLAYENPSLVTDYVTEGFSVPVEDLQSGKVLVFKWSDDHFHDITAMVRQRPDLLLPHPRETNYHLELSATEVQAGSDSYSLRIPELHNSVAIILYALDGKVMDPLKVGLDDRGELKMDVPTGTRRGTYTFVAVRLESDRTWVPVNRSIVVK